MKTKKVRDVIKEMEHIKVIVDWCGKNYASYISDPRINGVVLSTGKTFEKLKQETEDGLKFHLEGCIADGDPIPEAIRNGDYELVYEKRISAILHEAQAYTTLAAISRVTGIRHAQLSHYANAISQPRPEQRDRIMAGLHQIGNYCLSLL
ncbi:MAG: type II toxin-antitoxin system HicB family antitoxin [Bacteroidales bacterium]|nr:type II toxin-antitoxin system HicB family antitoxin [Bacteroidales bacterium]